MSIECDALLQMKNNKPNIKEERAHEMKSTDTIQQQTGRNTENIFGLKIIHTMKLKLYFQEWQQIPVICTSSQKIDFDVTILSTVWYEHFNPTYLHLKNWTDETFNACLVMWFILHPSQLIISILPAVWVLWVFTSR